MSAETPKTEAFDDGLASGGIPDVDTLINLAIPGYKPDGKGGVELDCGEERRKLVNNAAMNTLSWSVATVQGIGALLCHVGANNPEEFNPAHLLNIGWALSGIAKVQEVALLAESATTREGAG